VLEIDERPVRPESLRQLLARHDVTGMLEQHPEDLEGLILQSNARFASAQLARTEVELEHVEANDGGRPGQSFHPARIVLVV